MKIGKRTKLSSVLGCVCAASLICGSFPGITAKPVTAAESQNRIEDFANVLDITASPAFLNQPEGDFPQSIKNGSDLWCL